MNREHIRVMAVDPGKTCGWSFGRGYLPLQFGAEPWEDLLLRMSGRTWLDTIDRVVIERFHTRVLTTDSELTLEVIGGIKTVCILKGISYGMVNPSDKKKTMGDVSKEIKNKHAKDAEAIRLWDFKYGGNW